MLSGWGLVLLARLLASGQFASSTTPSMVVLMALGLLFLVLSSRVGSVPRSAEQRKIARPYRLRAWAFMGGTVASFPGAVVALSMPYVFFDAKTLGAYGLFVVASAIGGYVVAVRYLGQAIDSFRSAKQAILPGVGALVARDPSAPVLLLRSFTDDSVELQRSAPELWGVRLTHRFEESIKEHLASYGPLIAVGKPGSLPEFGAARAFLAEDAWQPQVLDWMAQAVLIVVMLGQTKWVRWEIEQIIDRHYLNKCVFLIPPGASNEHRWAILPDCFRTTAWSNALDAAQASIARSAYCAEDGRMVLFASNRATETGYGLSIQFAI